MLYYSGGRCSSYINSNCCIVLAVVVLVTGNWIIS